MTQAANTIPSIPADPTLNYASPAAPSDQPPLPVDTGPSLKSRTIRGSAWTIFGYGASQVLRLGSNILLWRLLAPELFGIMGFVYVLLQALQMFSDVGISQSLIQNPRGDEERFYNSAWTMQVLRGLLLWGCAIALARPVAAFYAEPQLRWLIPLVSFNAVIAGFNSTAIFRLTRHLAFGKLTLLELSTQSFSILVMLLWAWHDHSVLALVAGGFAGNLLTLVASHMLIRRQRNRFCWDRSSWIALFHFGKWVFLSTILTFVAQQAGQIIIPKVFTWSDAGKYGIALTMATMPTIAVMKVGTTVAFAVYSRVQHERTRFKSVFRRLRLPLLAGGGLIITGLIGCGPSLMRVISDARYDDAGWMLQLLAIGAWFQILECTAESALLAAGSVNWLAGGNAAKVVSLAIFIPLGIVIDQNNKLRGVVLAISLAEISRYLVAAYAVRPLGLRIALHDAGLTLWIAVGTGLALLAAHWLVQLPSRPWTGNALAVLGSGMVACALWGPVLLWAWRFANVSRDDAAREHLQTSPG